MKRAILIVLVTLLCVSAVVLIEAKALDRANQVRCQQNEYWHFVVTDAKTCSPEFIVVEHGELADDVSRYAIHGNSAVYSTTLHIDLPVTRAWAVKPCVEWHGQFNLSCPNKTPVTVETFTAHADSWFDTLLRWLRLQ
jgi:hypothetical protein